MGSDQVFPAYVPQLMGEWQAVRIGQPRTENIATVFGMFRQEDQAPLS